jgi:hypothetical protein
LDGVLESLRTCHGNAGGELTVSLAHAELRPTHFDEELIPAVALCASADAPKILDFSRTGLRDAEAQKMLAALASGAAPALRELRLVGNDALTSVTDAMLKGLAVMRPEVKVVR